MKKAVSILLALAMLLSLIPANITVFADTDPTEGFDYTAGTVIGATATDSMPWYIQASDSSNFTPSIESDGTNSYMQIAVPSTITDTTNHKSVQRYFNSGGLDGIVTYSFKLKLPSDVANGSAVYNSGTPTIWASVVDTGNREMATISATPAGTTVSSNHVPRTSDLDSDYTEGSVKSSVTFDRTQWITYTFTMDVNSYTYVLNITDGTNEYTSDSCYFRNYNRGFSGYTGHPSGLRVFFHRANTNALVYVDDVNVSNISSQQIATADLDGVSVPQNPDNDFALDLVGKIYGSQIAWSSNSPAIAIDGDTAVLNRGGSEVTATLTASITNSGQTYTKQFSVTVPRDSNISNMLNEKFDYTSGTVIGTAATTDMPWYIQASDTTQFTPSIEGDSTNTYLSMKANTTFDDTPATGSAPHKSVQIMFDNDGAQGIVNYSLKLYVPSDVANDSGTTYNSGTHNIWISLIDSAGYEMLTYAPIIRASGITMRHVPTTTTDGGTYTEAGSSSSFTFPLDTWFTFNAQIDTSENTYVFSVTDGTNTYTSNESVVRNLGRFSSYTGKPAGVRIYIERTYPNTLYYVDDIIIDELGFEYLVKEDIKEIEVPSEPVVDFSLPTVGEVYGSEITWSSNSSALAVDTNGNATLNPTDTDTAVTLTATVTKGTETQTQTYELTVKNSEYIAQKAMQVIIDEVTFEDISGYKEYYVKGDFTPNVPSLPDGITAEFTCSNDAIVIGDDGVAKVTRGESDTAAQFSLTLRNEEGVSLSKTFDILIQGNGAQIYEEKFDDSSMADKSISSMDGWSIENESADVSATGTTSYIRNTDGDGYLDTARYRAYDSNQYAYTDLSCEAIGDTVVQFRAKFSGSEDYWWIFYINGDYVKADGSVLTNTTVGQISFDTYHALLGSYCAGINGPTDTSTFTSLYAGDVPFDEWFNFRMIIHSTDCTYDLYINDTKLNSQPINAYKAEDGARITNLRTIRFGAARNFEWAGNYTVDDFEVRCLASDDELLDLSADNLTVTGTDIMFDIELSDTVGFDTVVTWESKNGYVTSDGKVTRQYGLGTTDETLVATIIRNGSSVTREFDIKIVKQPYYEIENISFEDVSGNETLLPTALGKIKSITLLENMAVEDAKLYVAVYNGDELSSVKIYDAANGDISSDCTLPDSDSLCVKAFVWNDMTPVAYNYKTGYDANENITIYVAGDSICAYSTKTASSDLTITQTGWGEVIGLMYNEDNVTVENHAKGGRSSRSFVDEGRLQAIIDKIQPGDYLFIKFGHNDQKPAEPEKYTTLGEDGTYRQYLQMYVDAARDKGAYPVLVTSIYRRRFSSGVPVNTQCGYPEEMTAYAQTVNVPLIDLHTQTGEWLAELGETDSAQYYMAHNNDNTHLTYYGALELNRMAKDEMETIGLPLNVYFK